MIVRPVKMTLKHLDHYQKDNEACKMRHAFPVFTRANNTGEKKPPCKSFKR